MVDVHAIDCGTDEDPVDTCSPGVRERPAKLVVTAVLAVEAPADDNGGDPVADPVEIVLTERETTAHRCRADDAEGLPLVVNRPPATWTSRTASPMSGLVCTGARSARWTHATRAPGGPWRRGRTPPSPKPACSSGAKASMSGHMTRCREGSSVGSRCRRSTRHHAPHRPGGLCRGRHGPCRLRSTIECRGPPIRGRR